MKKINSAFLALCAVLLLCAPIFSQTPGVIEVKEAEKFSWVGQAFSGSYNQMQTAVGGFIGEFFKQGLAPSGSMMGVYYNDPRKVSEAEYKWEIAFKTAPEATAKEPLSKKDFPGGPAIFYLHTGPYTELHTAYAKIHEFMEKEGYKPVWPSFDNYLNSPMTVKPEELQTLIIFPVEKK